MKHLLSILLILLISFSTAVWNGKRVASSDRRFKNIVRVFQPLRKGRCTGAIVGPHAVITAAHCVPSSCNDKGDFSNPDLEIQMQDGTKIKADACITHPKYLPIGKGFYASDIALIRLNRHTFKSWDSIANYKPYNGDSIVFAGYGQDRGQLQGTKWLQWGSGSITTTESHQIGVRADNEVGEQCIRRGDSGGPVYIENTDFNFKKKLGGIIGVANRGMENIPGNQLYCSWQSINDPSSGGRAFLRAGKQKMRISIPSMEPDRGTMIVNVVKANNVKPSDTGSGGDLYVKVFSDIGFAKTSRKDGTDNPVWNQHISFPVGFLNHLVVEVWDYDNFLNGGDDLVDYIFVKTGSLRKKPHSIPVKSYKLKKQGSITLGFAYRK